MFKYYKGDIFDSTAQVLVNPVNLVGAMGRGLALDVRNKFPELYDSYAIRCHNHQFKPGMLQLYAIGSDKFIMNFPTKHHWKNDSDLQLISLGLKKLVATYKQRGINSIAFPYIGGGLGHLDFEQEVLPVIKQYLSNCDLTVEIWQLARH